MKRPVATYTKITTRHGDPVSGSQYGKHIGTDYATPTGTVVVAPVSGRIVAQGFSATVGHYMEMEGNDGLRHRALHLSKREAPNGPVIEGQRIALSGSTGSTSTGPHVHWDARKTGTAFNGGFHNFVDTEALYQESIKPKPTPPTGGKRLYFDPIGQVATFYPVKGGEFKMKIADPSFNWSVLEDQGFRVRVNSRSAGGDCWVYIIYQTGANRGQRIPGRQVR